MNKISQTEQEARIEAKLRSRLKAYRIPVKFINLREIIQKLKPYPDLNIYEIDHIKPLSSFDLSKPQEVRKAFAPENCQWLTRKDNNSKSTSTVYPRIKETEEEQFEKELMRKGLSEKTIKKYMEYWRLIPGKNSPNEQILYEFLDAHSGSIPRAIAKIFAEVHKIKDFIPPRRTGRKASRLVQIMTEDEYDKLRKELYKRNVKWGLMFDLSYWCGLRREEVCNIAIDWFIFEGYEEGKSCRLKIIGKGNKQRLVIVPAWLMPTLLEYMKHRAEVDAINEKDHLFGVGVNWWWRVFTDMSERILNKHFKPHELRHTRTVMWRRSGVSIDQVSKRLGHTSIATTQRYWNLDPEEVAKSWEEEVS